MLGQIIQIGRKKKGKPCRWRRGRLKKEGCYFWIGKLQSICEV